MLNVVASLTLFFFQFWGHKLKQFLNVRGQSEFLGQIVVSFSKLSEFSNRGDSDVKKLEFSMNCWEIPTKSRKNIHSFPKKTVTVPSFPTIQKSECPLFSTKFCKEWHSPRYRPTVGKSERFLENRNQPLVSNNCHKKCPSPRFLKSGIDNRHNFPGWVFFFNFPLNFFLIIEKNFHTIPFNLFSWSKFFLPRLHSIVEIVYNYYRPSINVFF